MYSVEIFKTIISFLFVIQAQWEYLNNGRFKPYRDEINVIIENAFNDKAKVAEWQEQNASFRVEFDKMVEITPENEKLQVRRVTKGILFSNF